MTITPAMKGQITRRANFYVLNAPELSFAQIIHMAAYAELVKRMPRQQAKHATRKYLRSLKAA